MGKTAIHQLVKNGELDKVRALLAQQPAALTEVSLFKQPVHTAAEHGRIEILALFLSKSVSVDTRSSNGRTPLHVATNAKQTETVKFLLGRAAGVEEKDASGNTPLYCASGLCTIEIVRALVENGALLDEKCETGRTALHRAVVTRDVDAARYLIERGADVNALDAGMRTPLDWVFLTSGGASVCSRHEVPLRILRALLDAGAELDPPSPRCSPVSYAAAACDDELFAELLSRRQKLRPLTAKEYLALASRARDSSRHDRMMSRAIDIGPLPTEWNEAKPVMWWAISREDGKLLNRLIEIGEMGASATRLLFKEAVGGGNLQAAEMLLAEGADVNGVDENGQSVMFDALGLAARVDGDIELAAKTIRFLLARGARANVRNRYGRNPFDEVSGRIAKDLEHGINPCKYRPLLELLIEAGLDLSQDAEISYACVLGKGWKQHHKPGIKPKADVHAMAGIGDGEGIERALREDPSLANTRDERGNSPLHLVMGPMTARVLLENGASLEVPDAGGATPLIVFSRLGNLELVRLFLSRGASPNAKNGRGSTALHEASAAGHVELVKELIEHEADVNAQDNFGNTPLHAAYGAANLTIARYLERKGANASIRNRDGKTPSAG